MKGRPSLFEVMNKAPEASGPSNGHGGRRKIWPRKKENQGPVQVVAEALTEEEAAAALAEEAEAYAREQQEARDRADEAAARKAERKAARKAMRASLLASIRDRLPEFEGTAPVWHREDGRIVISMSQMTGLIALAAVVVLFLGTFFVGRYTVGGPSDPKMVQAAAKTKDAAGKPEGADAYLIPSNRTARQNSSATQRDPDLSAFRNPPKQEPTVRVNEGASVTVTSANRVFEAEEELNYLEIQWFNPRNRGEKQIMEDVRDSQRFLAENGVETVAKRWKSGIILRSVRGIPPSEEYARERNAFQQKVAQLGRAYRDAGGLYEWNDCFFVSASRAASGDPL